MPFFRKASRASAEKAEGAKTKKQKDSKKKGGLFLGKKKKPLINYEDASRASSTQPQPSWNKIEIETDFTGMQLSTKGNVKTPLVESNKKAPGIVVDSGSQVKGKQHQAASDKNWNSFEKNVQPSVQGNEENIAFSTMRAIQESEEMDFAKHNPVTDQQENEPLGPIDTDEYVARNPGDSGEITPPREISGGDDFTLTYSQSVASEVDDETVQRKSENDATGVDDEPELLLEEEVDEEPKEEPEDDSDPSMSAYISPQRIQNSDLTYESTSSSFKPTRSDEDSQRSEWKPKSDMSNPLGATAQEIDALNRFLSVVGPNFNGCNLSFGDRKQIYDGARKVGLNKVLVDKFLDQSAGIATVEEATTFSDISPSSTYSSTSRSLMMAKSDFSDSTSTTGYSRASDNSDSIRYKFLPRTSDSPHANQTYGCKGIFGDFLWNDSKKARKDIFKTGQGILEKLGAVVVGEDGSIHGEA